MNYLAEIFLIFLLSNLIIEIYLNVRNIKNIKIHKNQVPADFADKITLEEHTKAANYNIEKLKFSNVKMILSTSILLLLLFAGGFSYLYSLSFLINELLFNDAEIIHGVIFLLSCILTLSVLDLPFSIFDTFFLEKKFGFNKTTFKTYIVDLLKSLTLLILLGGFLLYGLLYIIHAFWDSAWWLYAWIFWMTFSLILLMVYPKFIAPLFNKFTHLENTELSQSITRLLEQAGFKSKGVFVMDGSKRSSKSNAYFTGFGANKRIVFFDTLIKQLKNQEIIAVLAHELGHFKHGHIKIRIIQSAIFSLAGLFILYFLANNYSFYTAFGFNEQNPAIALLLFSIVIPTLFFFITPINAFISRKHEFQADEFAAKHADKDDLINALLKLYKENAGTLTPDSLYSSYHDSHPPAAIRINHLKTL